ncbi:hypothetical protein B296_00036035 [Ensete ventricosum]|uniref:Response regulatory domain-containing protein n=1 Tax=Ensete ventricosum TaxID=4639 RepID=A0A427A440_ENSVE|nr:hypothetical protein B296_00036035 [Ensete ventricosum]
MKGIAHGACDYLLKPVRIEELKNIWQHVVRRRKFSQKDYSNFDNVEESERHQIVSSDGGQDLNISGSANQNGKLSRKRKDQNEEDDDDCEENVHENDDLTTQKKPRVVWSIDLHRKFVAAVNQWVLLVSGETYFDPRFAIPYRIARNAWYVPFRWRTSTLGIVRYLSVPCERDEISLMDGDTGCDFYPLGACM